MYPALATFLQQHPEVGHNPEFFLGASLFLPERNGWTPQMEAARALRDVAQFGSVLLIVITITTGVILLIRAAAEHRRWQRASRAQAELNNKLIDRFAASNELLRPTWNHRTEGVRRPCRQARRRPRHRRATRPDLRFAAGRIGPRIRRRRLTIHQQPVAQPGAGGVWHLRRRHGGADDRNRVPGLVCDLVRDLAASGSCLPCRARKATHPVHDPPPPRP